MPPRIHDTMPAGPAIEDTWLAENSQPEPKIEPSPMKVRSVRLSRLWNLPCALAPCVVIRHPQRGKQ